MAEVYSFLPASFCMCFFSITNRSHFPKSSTDFFVIFSLLFFPPPLAQGSPTGNLWKAETKDDCPKIVSAFEILSRGPSLSVGTSSELFHWGNILSSIGSLHGVWELLSFPRFAHRALGMLSEQTTPALRILSSLWSENITASTQLCQQQSELTVSWCISECIRLKLRLPFCC